MICFLIVCWLKSCQASETKAFPVTLSVVVLQAPFTPFLTELMYQTLRHLFPELSSKEDSRSIHYLLLPEPRRVIGSFLCLAKAHGELEVDRFWIWSLLCYTLQQRNLHVAADTVRLFRQTYISIRLASLGFEMEYMLLWGYLLCKFQAVLEHSCLYRVPGSKRKHLPF